MDEFPKMLYRSPGSLALAGGTFSTLIVQGQDEQDDAVAEGWHVSSPKAKAAFDAPPSDAETAPPTRAELEQKAAELGLKFDGRTGDKKLAAMVSEAAG